MVRNYQDKEWECSFARAGGGRSLRASQRRLMDELLPKLAVPYDDAAKLAAMMDGYSSVAMEIGFGAGEHLVKRALEMPDRLWIGGEPFVQGMASCLSKIHQQGIENIRLHHGDARDLLMQLPDGCLSSFYLLFPDPWPKLRHHKRRIVSLPFLELVAAKLHYDGEVWLATDHEGYAHWMAAHLSAQDDLVFVADCPSDFRQMPEGWIKTRYQIKAKAGDKPWYFRLMRRNAPLLP